VQNIDAEIGHYIISDKPMTEEEWIMQRTVMEQKRAPKQVEADATQTQRVPETPEDLVDDGLRAEIATFDASVTERSNG
jgi:hypothetical protein